MVLIGNFLYQRALSRGNYLLSTFKNSFPVTAEPETTHLKVTGAEPDLI